MSSTGRVALKKGFVGTELSSTPKSSIKTPSRTVYYLQ
jgi:hypothetical protein